MADRTVSVKFRVDTGNADQKIRGLQKSTEAYAKAGSSLRDNASDWDTIAKASGGAGLAVAAGLGKATMSFANFDQAMSAVKVGTGATGAELQKLEQAAIDMGATTAFSATEAAAGIENLGKAGVDTEAILGGGLKGALDLAAVGQMEVGAAAEVAATAMTQFNLSGQDVPHIADLLAAAAGEAQGEVSDMAQALNQSGLVAAQMGLSIEETTGSLAAFASAGLIGSDAGTSFKTMLQRLANPSKEAAGLMDELGINAYDAQGNFVGMSEVAGQLESALKPLPQAQRDAAMATIFGSDAIRAANVLYTEGAAGIESWTTKVNDQGRATRDAATLLDNLRGDLEELGGALETAFIGAGSVGNDALRGLVQDVTTLVNVFSDLPGPVQEFVVKGAAAAAVLGVMGGAGIKTAQGVAELAGAWKKVTSSLAGVKAAGVASEVAAAGRAASSASGGFQLLSIQTEPMPSRFGKIGDAAAGMGGKIKSGLSGVTTMLGGPWGVAFLAAGAVVGAFAQHQLDAKQRADELRDSLDQQTGAVTENTREWANKELQQGGWLDKYAEWGGNIQDLSAALAGEEDARSRVNAVLSEASAKEEAAAAAAVEAAGGYSDAQENLQVYGTQAEQLQSILGGVSADIEEQGAKTRQLAEANAEAAVVTAEQATAVLGLGDALRSGLSGATVEATEAAGGFVSRSQEVLASSEDVATAFIEWRDGMAGVAAGFVDLSAGLGETYEGLEAYKASLREMVEAQASWQSNMIQLSGRVSQGMLDELARLGPEGAPLVADLVNASDAELAEMETLFAARGAESTGAFATAMYDAGPVVAAAAAALGDEAAAKIAEQIASGEITAAEAVAQYNLEAYVNVGANTDDYGATVGAVIGLTEQTPATVHVQAEDSAAQGVRVGLQNDINGTHGTAHLHAEDSAAQGVRVGLQNDINATSGTASVYANTDPALGEAASAMWTIGGMSATATVHVAITQAITTVRTTIDRMASGLAALGGRGYAYGGFTGYGGKWDEAGVVHKGEFVQPQEVMRKPGQLAFQTDLWAGLSLDEAYRRHKLRGYAEGGLVGHRFVQAPAAMPSLSVNGPDLSALSSQMADLSRQVFALAERPVGPVRAYISQSELDMSVAGASGRLNRMGGGRR